MRSPSKYFFSLLLLVFWVRAPMTAFAQSLTDTGSAHYSDSDSSAYSSPANDDFIPARNTAAFTKAQWDSLTSDKEFAYKDEREYTFEKKDLKPPKIPGWMRALAAFFRFFTTTTGLVILFAILAIIVFFIVYQMVSGDGGFFARRPRNIQEEKPDNELSEEDLLESDWEEKMQVAMKNGEYRLAIRYGYLMTLQMLQRRSLILYRQDKTNTDYYRELAKTGEPLRPGFRTLTRAYEWAWYGGQPSGKEEADAYFKTFNALKSGIQ